MKKTTKNQGLTAKETLGNMLKNGHITKEEHDNAMELIKELKLELYGHN